MKNLMVWVRKMCGIRGIRYKLFHNQEFARVLCNLRAQIDNSLRVGWKKEDIIIFTNFRFRHRGISGIEKFPIYGLCSYVNKWTALKQLWDTGCKDDVWCHDLDAWQCVPFGFPSEVEKIGFVRYRFGMQTGSVFIRYGAREIINEYLSSTSKARVKNDEHLWTEWQAGHHTGDIVLLNTTYNVGRVRWWRRYSAADKPVKVIHIKPEEPWKRIVLSDGREISANKFLAPEGLQAICRKYNLWHVDNDRVVQVPSEP